MRRIITLTVLVSAAALLFTGCMLCDSAQYTLCSGVRAGGHTMTHEEMDMYKAGAGYQLYAPGMHSGSNVRPMVSPGTRGLDMGRAGSGSPSGMHSGANIRPMVSPGTRGMNMGKAGMGSPLYTPRMHSGSNVRPMVSPGTRGMNMGKAGMGSQMLTPRMHSGARIGPMSTPGACKSPFSGLMPALKFLNPLRWFAPWTAPGGPC